MHTLDGPTLNPDQFQSPFDEAINDLVEKGHVLHTSLQDYMRPRWKHRPLEILIIDNPELYAYAMDCADRDRICVFRGTFERLYGTILGLLSTPTFLPMIGDVRLEVAPQDLPAGGFRPIPLLRNSSNADRQSPFFFPNDQQRMILAEILIGLALAFLVYHEMGHILGGHLEFPLTNAALSTISEFAQPVNEPDTYALRHVLECDAAAFSCHVTSLVHNNNKMAESLCGFVNAPGSGPKDLGVTGRPL